MLCVRLGSAYPRLFTNWSSSHETLSNTTISYPIWKLPATQLGVAELFVGATDSEHQRSSIVAVAWNVMGSQLLTAERECVKFREFGDRPMLFIDVFEEPHAAKIVDPKNSEIRSADLLSFSEEQSVALAQLLRSNYAGGSLSSRGAGRTFFQEMKRQGGF